MCLLTLRRKEKRKAYDKRCVDNPEEEKQKC